MKRFTRTCPGASGFYIRHFGVHYRSGQVLVENGHQEARRRCRSDERNMPEASVIYAGRKTMPVMVAEANRADIAKVRSNPDAVPIFSAGLPVQGRLVGHVCDPDKSPNSAVTATMATTGLRLVRNRAATAPSSMKTGAAAAACGCFLPAGGNSRGDGRQHAHRDQQQSRLVGGCAGRTSWRSIERLPHRHAHGDRDRYQRRSR